MIRIAGILLLAGCSVTVGVKAADHLYGRVDVLDQLIEAMEIVRRDMDYSLTALPELLEGAAGQCTGDVKLFFELCAEGSAHLNGRTFREVWSHALEASQIRLEEEDIRIVLALGSVLGRYDGESQQRAIGNALIRLRQRREEASEQSERMGNIYRALGIAAGVFLVILLV